MIIPKSEGNTLPSINFDESIGAITIEGRSTEKCPEKFYYDFIEYLEEYLKKPRNLYVTMSIEYFNTRTAKPLLDFLITCQSVIDAGYKLRVDWIIEEGDESMLEAAEDYSSILKFPFNIIEKR
jgi:SiaC family regulatory phosphoprotein